MGYQHSELITSIANTQVLDDLPVQGADLIFSSVPGQSDSILTAIHSGGDKSQYIVTALINGTEWGAATPVDALPKSLELLNANYSCDKQLGSPSSSSVSVCCKEVETPPPPSPLLNVTKEIGDIEVLFDVTWVGPSDHWVLVTILNKQILRRVEAPGWLISWKWARQEIIWDIKGAQATDSGQCLTSPAAVQYGASIENAHTCSRQPHIMDLTPDAYDASSYPDPQVLSVTLACCKNGTMGVPTFPSGDPAFADIKGNSSISQFRMKVGRVKAAVLNPLKDVAAPYALNLGIPGFNCSTPIKMQPPSTFPVNALRNVSAIVTWKYICKRDLPNVKTNCCVSFSAFYNHSKSEGAQSSWLFGNWLSHFDVQGPLFVSPCPSCACGCNATNQSTSASTTSRLSLAAGASVPLYNASNQCAVKGQVYDAIGTEGDIVPTKTWQNQPALSAQCQDHCPVHVHWHVTDFFLGGWLAKLTIANRGDQPITMWYTAIQLGSVANLTAVYSFNNFTVNDTTALIWGRRGSNDWILGTKAANTFFGNVKSVLQFGHNDSLILTNKTARQLFPSKVIFDGQECALPISFPEYTPKAPSTLAISLVYIALISAVFFTALVSYGILV